MDGLDVEVTNNLQVEWEVVEDKACCAWARNTTRTFNDLVRSIV